MDSINPEVGQGPYPLQQFVRACQSWTAGTVDYAYQSQFLILRVFAKGPLPLPEICKAGNRRISQILAALEQVKIPMRAIFHLRLLKTPSGKTAGNQM
jgi:hypothetical protein